MRLSEFLKEAAKSGCYWAYNGSTHEYWYSPITDQYFKVSYDKNKDLKPWLEHKLRKESGVKK